VRWADDELGGVIVGVGVVAVDRVLLVEIRRREVFCRHLACCLVLNCEYVVSIADYDECIDRVPMGKH
jgi:hypothetical protein